MSISDEHLEDLLRPAGNTLIVSRLDMHSCFTELRELRKVKRALQWLEATCWPIVLHGFDMCDPKPHFTATVLNQDAVSVRADSEFAAILALAARLGADKELTNKLAASKAAEKEHAP